MNWKYQWLPGASGVNQSASMSEGLTWPLSDSTQSDAAAPSVGDWGELQQSDSSWQMDMRWNYSPNKVMEKRNSNMNYL